MVGFLRRIFGSRSKARVGRHSSCSGRYGHFIHMTESGWRCCRCWREFDAGTREPKSTGRCACPVEQRRFVGRNQRDDIIEHIDNLWLPGEDTVVTGAERVRRRLAANANGQRWTGKANAA